MLDLSILNGWIYSQDPKSPTFKDIISVFLTISFAAAVVALDFRSKPGRKATMAQDSKFSSVSTEYIRCLIYANGD
jgi:hypothetical protein